MAWDDHVATLKDFWEWQLLGERGDTGHSLSAHEPVHARTPFLDAHDERWRDHCRFIANNEFASAIDSPHRRLQRQACGRRFDLEVKHIVP